PGASLPYSEFSQRMENMNFAGEFQPAPELGSVPEFVLRRTASPAPRFDFVDPSGAGAVGFMEPVSRVSIPETHGPLFPGAHIPEPENLEALKDLHPLGQIHESFIVAAGRD